MDFQVAPLAVSSIPDGLRITFNGPIHTNVAWLESELDRIVRARPKLVELDLLRTEHISSVGLGVLVNFSARISTAGGAIRVVAIRKQTLRILRIARLDTLFQFAKDAVHDGASE
jgi:anti-anti-sigma factor